MFAIVRAETKTVPEQTFNKAFAEQIGNLGLILTSVVLAAFSSFCVIVGNSMVLALVGTKEGLAS